MALPVKFFKSNDVLGKPENNSNHQVLPLHICRVLTPIPGIIPSALPQQTLAFYSFWEFTPEELEEVIRNNGVFIKIWGTTTYPLSVTGWGPQRHEDDRILTEEEISIIKKL